MKKRFNPAGTYLFKFNDGNTGTVSENCSKLAIKKLERLQWRSGVFIINFEEISQIILMFPSLTLIIEKEVELQSLFLTPNFIIVRELVAFQTV